MKSTVVDESLSSFKPMYCSREYQTSTRLNQQYEKSTLNDIYVVDDKEYEELKERHAKAQYKLMVCKSPATQNMPHEEEYDDNNYESIDETAI